MVDVEGAAKAAGSWIGKMVTVAAPRVAGAPAPPAGGGFKFKAQELDHVIKQWEDLRDALKDDEYDAEHLTSVDAPGREFASGDFTKQAGSSGKSFYEANQLMQKYVDAYVDALKAAKQKISTQEEQAQDDVARAGEQGA